MPMSMLYLALTFLAKIFSNELGWIAGSQYPTRWIRPYIAAWKPGWCLTIDLIFTILSMLVAGFVLYIWHYMEPDEEFIDSMTTDVESESLKPIKPEKLTVKFEDDKDSEANFLFKIYKGRLQSQSSMDFKKEERGRSYAKHNYST